MEKKDKELFDRIAYQYTKKDRYPPSRIARKFRVSSALQLLDKSFFNHILEIGCGPGFSSEYLKNNYNKFTGVDYSDEFIKIAKSYHPKAIFIQGNIKAIESIVHEEVDLILGVGVLHHIDDLDHALKSLKKICNKNTILLFDEPQKGNPLIQILRFIRKKLDRSYSEDQIFFSKNELKTIFQKNGFKIENIKYQGYFSTPFAQIIIKPSFIFNTISFIAIQIDKFIQRYLNNPLSWNIQIALKIQDE